MITTDHHHHRGGGHRRCSTTTTTTTNNNNNNNNKVSQFPLLVYFSQSVHKWQLLSQLQATELLTSTDCFCHLLIIGYDPQPHSNISVPQSQSCRWPICSTLPNQTICELSLFYPVTLHINQHYRLCNMICCDQLFQALVTYAVKGYGTVVTISTTYI